MSGFVNPFAPVKRELEKDAETLLKNECEKNGAHCLKLRFVSFVGAPDRLVLCGRPVFVELKKPGGKLSKAQVMVHELLKSHGCEVVTLIGVEGVREWCRVNLSSSK